MITKRADNPQIQNDFKKLFALSMSNTKESVFLGKDNWFNWFDALISDAEEMAQSCYVAYGIDNSPIGYMIASPNEPNSIYLSEIFVLPDCRGLGISKMMLRDVAKMNHATKFHAYVHEDNKVMQHVLESMGGMDAGKWKDYIVNIKPTPE